MSGGGSSTQTTQVQIPGWMQSASRNNINYANQIGPLMDNYAGPRVAGTNDIQQGALSMLSQGLGGFRPLMDAAGNLIQGVGDFVPSNVAAPGMNQYTSDVIDRVIADTGRAYDYANSRTGARAATSGAFGGDRHALMLAENARNMGDTVATTAANLRMNAFENQAGRDMQAQLANQQAGFAGQNMRLAAGQGLAGLAGQGQSMLMNDVNALSALGGQQQMTQQAQYDAALQQYLHNLYAPANDLQRRIAAVGGAVYPTTQTTTTQQPGMSTGQMIMGGVGAGLSLLGMPMAGTMMGSLGGALFPPK